jgi:type II secretory pathway pseudopilin PulG
MMAGLPKTDFEKRAVWKQVGQQHAFFVGIGEASAIGQGHEKKRRAVKPTAFMDERGESLVEILVSVVIMAVVITAFLAALSTGVSNVAIVRKRVTAENLARAQLEHIKNYPYEVGAETYPIVEQPEYYTTTIDISYWDKEEETFTTDQDADFEGCGGCGMQWITVTVSYDGKPVFTVADYKLNR